MNQKYIFYVYAYLRSTDSTTAPAGTPYYIGKGKEFRAWESHGKLPIPKDKSNIILLETNLTEIGAFALERRMIRWYGRKDLRTGILNNKTDGGDGVSGRIVPEDIRVAHSIKMKGRISPNKGKSPTDETKEKISNSLLGNIPWNKGIKTGSNPEHSKKMKGRVPWNAGLKTPGVGGVKKGNIPWNKGLGKNP